MAICNKCPRACNIDIGRVCGVGELKVAKIMKHYYEEPVISGANGSGAIFFSGCNLKCCFCQNMPISHGLKGEVYSVERLAEEIFKLQREGVHNINIVTASHLIAEVSEVLKIVKPNLTIPVVYNSSGYEGDLKPLSGLVDVYLPDFKYFDRTLAQNLSKAPDYPEVAKRAIAEMIDQVGEVKIEDGIIKRGVIIRHLVLPGHRDDSIKIMQYIAEHFPLAYVSIMSQYTPEFNVGPKELNRKVTAFEYNSVVNAAADLGLRGFMQDKSSACADFTPSFT
ncbi:MAG: radical SAM protein [Clostridiales bacterium]|nr:radical SAM protein [Clostridiales bacterium]